VPICRLTGSAARGKMRAKWGVEGVVRLRYLVLAGALALAGCGWFGSKDDETPVAAGSAKSSDEILKKDCADEQWKQENLGLWYSVCRQPMKW
jgi:hypothetical protein